MFVQAYRELADQWYDSEVEHIQVTLPDGTSYRVHDSTNIKEIGTETSESAQKPRYSQKTDGKWYGLDDSLKTITEGHKTHKELKKELDVDSVKGYTLGEEKYYALIYPPSEC